MYTDYYKFKALPFQLTPDGNFFFESNVHSRAMGFLNYGIMHGEGFVVVTGEVGAGKTTLVEHLIANLDPARFLVGRIVTTQLDSDNLLRMAAAALGIPQIGLDKASLLMRVRQLVSTLNRARKHALLIVDEAQSLSKEALEELRMLSNITDEGGVPIQGILLGQPEFRDIMAGPELEQLRQRVIASCHLGALDADDTRSYIEHRLRHVGWDEINPTFSTGAFAEIYHYTRGIPRKINTLVSRLLLLGFLDKETVFSSSMVGRVAREISEEISPLAPDTPGSENRYRTEANAANAGLHELQKDLLIRISNIERRLDGLEGVESENSTVVEPPTPISRFR